MKIAYICTDVEIPVFVHEGSSIHIREVTHAMAEAGHEVVVLAAWLGGDRPDGMRARVTPIEPRGLDAAAWASLAQEPAVVDRFLDRDLKSVLVNTWLQDQGAELFRTWRPDFIYERYALFGWGGLALSRRLGVPLILEVNAPIAAEQEGYERFTLMQTADRMEREVLGGADALVAVSAVVGDWTLTRGASAERLMVIPNAVARARFERPGDGAGIRTRYGLADKRVVGFVGSFQAWHDAPSLIRAFGQVLRRHGDVHLLLVGYGPQREEMGLLVEQLGLQASVTFAGSVPHAEMVDILAAMDVAVAPYPRWTTGEFHGSPMKIFEYMAAGRPIVAAALGQVGGIIADGRTGLLYPPGDDAALAAALDRMLADPRAAAAMGAAARDVAMREHTWNAVTERILGRARKLVAARGCPA